MRPTRRQALAGAAAALIAGPAVASAAPRRVVSLNACLDAILVHVADRGQIAALSHYAREPVG
ncbi:MAG TPA: ABC transporter substrate-binding protein, partial [Brevundimonas sp.]|nr:ABC transporter substrate-binding protein [Brevundimonas sp.]